jgi:hypothetical protein
VLLTQRRVRCRRAGGSVRFQGDLDPEVELNTLVVAGQPFARLDRFQGDFSAESAQNIDVWDGSE